MSIPLPAVSLATVSIGQTGVVSFANTGISAGGITANPASIKRAGTVLIYNESGSGLLIQFQTSQSGFFLPAGAWQPVEIQPGETGYTWTVVYNLPDPPVTLLLTTYYFPGETIPPQPTLGNSPIGIGGTVNTSSVQTLSNIANTSLTLVISIGQSNTQLVTINNDGSFIWNILRSGVAHQLFLGQDAFHSLILGNASDIVEVAASQLSVDGNLLTAGLISNSNGSILGWHALATPYLFENSVTLTAGTTTVTLAGNGSIPANATMVAIAVFGVSAVAGSYVQMGPQAATFSNKSTYPVLYETQVNGNDSVGNAVVPLNTANGQIDIKVIGTHTTFSASVFAYLA